MTIALLIALVGSLVLMTVIVRRLGLPMRMRAPKC